MKKVFESVISRGGYDLTRLLERIDAYHVSGRLSDADRAELIAMARGDAVPSGMDIPGEIQRLWAALRELTARLDNQSDGTQTSDPAADWRQPTGAHDAYFSGDRIRWQGKVYACCAPAGVACVWPPDVMPDYWQEVQDDV